jgi:hypothetical protein
MDKVKETEIETMKVLKEIKEKNITQKELEEVKKMRQWKIDIF